jgi:hypothetical protein
VCPGGRRRKEKTDSMLSQIALSPSLKYGISAGAAFLAISLFLQISTIRKVPIQEPIRSPRKDISKSLSQEELDNLPYPPDVFPGGRDVETPYGFIRVFEWGPEEGRKVLLVHGISTPAMALGGLAEELVKKGCRVMLFGKFSSSIWWEEPKPSHYPKMEMKHNLPKRRDMDYLFGCKLGH